VPRTDDSPSSRAKPEQATPVDGGLAPDELAAEAAVDLPDREAMTTIRGLWGLDIDNFAMPINSAEAANISTTDSYAIADADQVVILDQDSDESP
jgi:hypothetical protein